MRKKIFVTGASGQVGREVVAQLRGHEDIEAVATSHSGLDITVRSAVHSAIADARPDVIIHCAAFTQVDECESQRETAYAVNAIGTRHVADAARMIGAHVVYVSTDYVFDGTADRAYVEWDSPNPMSVYGQSKLGGERELDASATIARTSWVCGRYGSNMVKTILRLVRDDRGPLRFVDDQKGCPTIAIDLAGMLIRLALDRRPGIFHVTNQGPTTWFEFARAVVDFAGGDPKRVEPIPTSALYPPRPAPRPANSVLDNLALRLSGVELLDDWQPSTAALVSALIN